MQDVEIFVAVARNQSFARAAERLATSKSNVGKAVQRLESQLGTKLFQRTTRAVRLTEDGQIYLEPASAAIAGLIASRATKCNGLSALSGGQCLFSRVSAMPTEGVGC